MIYVEKTHAEEKDFIALLERSEKSMLVFLNGKQNISPIYFETVVFDHMRDSAKGSIFEGTVKQTGTHAFPDIVAKGYFGVEVKMTVSDHWTSTGNSVLESSRVEDIQRIYIVFGKFGGKLAIRHRLYQECLPEVSVTHSPRYRINMDLPPGKSIFDKIGVDYDTLRNDPNPIQKIKDYYRSRLKDGEELWWIDQDAGDREVSPIIKQFRNLNGKEKESFLVEAMILFPEMFGNKTTKFERAATYLIAEYNAVSASLRDSFTAGGRVSLKIKRKKVLVPQIASNLYANSKAIVRKIDEMDPKTLLYYWHSRNINKNRLAQWLRLVNKQFSLTGSRILASDIFDAGLL